MAAQDYVAVVQQLYVSYFGRPADYYGLQSFTAQLDALKAPTDFETLNATVQKDKAGTTALSKLVNSFNASAESAALYGTDASIIGLSKFVAAIYTNVLNREADVEGLNFWVGEIAAGRLTRANAAMAITDGALHNTTDQGLLDAKAVENKLAVATNFTAAIDTTGEINGYAGDAAAASARALLAQVNDTTDVAAFQSTVESTLANIVVDQIPTVNTSLTTGVDNIVGSAGKDVISAIIDGTTGAVKSTLSTLDVIDAKGGNDVLNLDVLNGNGAAGAALAGLPSVTVSGLETVNVRAAVGLTADFSTWSGLTAVNVTQGTAVAVTGAATTTLSVAGATGAVSLDGGASQTVNTSGTTVTLGATTTTAGAISVTHTAEGANDIVIDGGSTVTVTSTGSTAGSDIKIGQTGTKQPTGAVNVTTTNTAVAGTDATTANVLVKGGTTVNVTQNATSDKAATDTTGSTVTLGNVTIEGTTKTTAVTVKQTASTAEVAAVTAVAGTTETASVKFGALKSGDVLTLDANANGTADAGELSFTAGKDMTAAEVAAAFSNLVNLDTQSNGPAKNGVYTGAASLWTSAAASGDTVVFSSTTANTNVTDLAFVLTNTSTNSVAPVVTATAGAGATTGKTGVLGVINGTVLVDDNATAASITTITVDGYGDNSKLGNTNTLSKLSDLTLANSGGTLAGDTDATMDVDAAGITSLNLTVNAIGGAVNLDASGAASIKTLNLKATGADSTFALTAAAVEALAVSGDKVAALTADLAAVKTITVTGAAGLTTDVSTANTITSINTTGTTGTVTSFLDGAVGTYTGGAGKDILTLATSTALTKAIDLGAGDDTLSFAALTVTGTTAAIKGGDGVDTLSMTVAAAAGLDNSTVFASQVSGFEHLTLNNINGTADGVVDAVTIDLANLGGYNYVTTSGTQVNGVGGATATDTLTLDKLASNGTLVLTAQGNIAVNVADASTGTADVLNVVLTSASALTAGTVTAANVETINLTATDTNSTAHVDTLTLTAGAAKTVTVAGNAGLTLTLTGSTAVTTIDAHSMTKGLTVTSLNTTDATTITGGSGNDSLTAATGTTADVLIGGAGNDTLVANAGLDTLTGGDGADTFVIGTASLNSSSYATITDFGVNDLIKFTGASKFTSAKVTQADTAVFQDYANAAINALGAGEVAWFQYSGNTYIVMDAGADTATFTNGQDFIVKLTGLVDLTNATFNNTSDTIGIF